jgi:hypothetical protein
VTGLGTRIYEIQPEPGTAERAAIVAALEQIAREAEEAADTRWSRAARHEVVDDARE